MRILLRYINGINRYEYRNANEHYCKTIKENRINKGYSLKELANLTFLPVSTVKRAEHGSLFVKFDEYIKIFYVLNMIHPDFL